MDDDAATGFQAFLMIIWLALFVGVVISFYQILFN